MVTYANTGAFAAGTTSLAVPYPTGTYAGQMLLLMVTNKHGAQTVTTPTGFTAGSNSTVTGGTGTDGTVDQGTLRVSMYWKIADGTESGNLSVTVTSGNACMGIMYSLNKSNALWDTPLFTNGADNTGNASPMVVSGATNLSVTVGDYFVSMAGVNSDSAVIGASSIAATSATLSNQSGSNSSTANGTDMAFVIRRYDVTAGTSTAAPVFSVVATPTAASTPAGAAVFVRLRDVYMPPMSSMGVGF